MNHNKSKELYEEAKKYIPGGVNSPVRAFNSVGMDSLFVDKAKGSKIYDVDGNEYIDYICSWGPLIFGHSNEIVYKDMEKIFKQGISYGITSQLEIKLAKLIVEAYPSVEMVRMVNSGTEATMSALRLARGYTNRSKILKFEGCYHGHSDGLLVKSGSGTLTFGSPTSSGVTEDAIKNTIVSEYNNIELLDEIFSKQGEEIAAVIIEPVAGNMGVVPASYEFLKHLRYITQKYNTLLIFDEVITGFRVAFGGAQEIYDINPDLTCFGKIIGGGLPVGAYGGKREIMEMIAPLGPVYQAGTLSGNPLAMHLGYNTLSYLKGNPDIYNKIENMAIKLEDEITKDIVNSRVDATVNRFKGMLNVFFSKEKINSFDDVDTCDTKIYEKYFKGMMKEGVLLPPSQYEGMFLSSSHSEEDINKTLEANFKVMKSL
ncbi:MAG: glutamate-1-semialdehyde 2,1-aminomutase [Eubacteriaceae bacterium]